MRTSEAKRRGELLIQAADIIESWDPELRDAIIEVLADDVEEITPEPPKEAVPRWECPQPECPDLLTERYPSNHWRFSTKGQVEKPASGVWHSDDRLPKRGEWPPPREPDNGVPYER